MAFDDKLQYYFKTIDEVEGLPMVKEQECIRLHMGPLAQSVKGHAKQWITHLGKILRDSAKEGLFQLRDLLDVRTKKDDVDSIRLLSIISFAKKLNCDFMY